MLEGKLLIRKVELTRPTFRLVRDRNGRFNLEDVCGPIDLSEHLPPGRRLDRISFVLTQADAELRVDDLLLYEPGPAERR